jgi:hypothetical protein
MHQDPDAAYRDRDAHNGLRQASRSQAHERHGAKTKHHAGKGRGPSISQVNVWLAETDALAWHCFPAAPTTLFHPHGVVDEFSVAAVPDPDRFVLAVAVADKN